VTGSQIPAIIGIAGWKKSGKTTLVERLVAELTRRGLRVATVKHAHHDFAIDDAETDSARHRRAGASQVAIVSSRRWALVNELRGAPEPGLADIVEQFAPCDLVVVEGYKAAPIPKIEVRRTAARDQSPLCNGDPNVIALATDHGATHPTLPAFALDDVNGIADFIVRAVGAGKGRGG
jgi:molybdopterin-guanine dinucleotide biosynthesis protein B